MTGNLTALAAAVRLTTATAGGIDIDPADLVDDLDPLAVAAETAAFLALVLRVVGGQPLVDSTLRTAGLTIAELIGDAPTERTTTMTTAIAPTTLHDRLAEAEREAQPAAAEVNKLEAAIKAAVDRQDFDAAKAAQTALPAAREAAAIKAAVCDSLRAAIGRIAEQQRTEQLEIQRQQRLAEARANVEPLGRQEREAIAETKDRLDKMRQALDEARAHFRAAEEAERRAGHARQEAHNCLVELGERDPMRISAPNTTTVLRERDELVRLLMRTR